MKLFFQSFTQVGLVAVNTWLISRGYIVSVFLVSFLISLIWAFNVAKVSISTTREKIIYALGAGFGAITGLLILKSI
jgi:hypothetical protein